MKEFQDDMEHKVKNPEEDQEISGTWAADAQDELEDWIEEQGIQLRY